MPSTSTRTIRHRRAALLSGPLVASLVMTLLLVPSSAESQVLGRIKRAIGRAAEAEVTEQMEKLVRDGVRCVFDDTPCIARAKAAGKDVVLTDDSGNLLRDDDGKPISDPEKVDDAVSSEADLARPGEGAWANYDFVPGDSILLFEDFTRDRVGDFPRRLELVEGNWEIVDWEGGRYLRATSNGLVGIPLPSTLPDRFTIEFSVNLKHGNAFARLMTAPGYYGRRRGEFTGSAVSMEYVRAGVRAVKDGPTSLATMKDKRMDERIMPVRVSGDGKYLKIYLDEQRVGNVPNAIFPRSDTLYLAVGWASEPNPILIGPLRIAKGGVDLYERIDRDGRVATQGILFGQNSDRIRPESTPTLEAIAAMLAEHPELALEIEGHTDADGEEEYNLTLSQNRAIAVKDFLVEKYGIAETRLTTSGFGESRPAGSNETPEGKQQNRRVELVRK